MVYLWIQFFSIAAIAKQEKPKNNASATIALASKNPLKKTKKKFKGKKIQDEAKKDLANAGPLEGPSLDLILDCSYQEWKG